MRHITIGKHYNEGKIAFVKCENYNTLGDLNIKDECFLLLVLFSGSMTFQVGEKTVTSSGPCFICFDEKENPILLSKQSASFFTCYFHPCFLNINMSFDLVRSKDYGDIATTHDMFLLRPFLEGGCAVPILTSYISSVEAACNSMASELTEQSDWYWSCRSRSYFMEIIIALERMYSLLSSADQSSHTVKSSPLRAALFFIESHYMENITLADISAAAKLSHTALTTLLKKEFGLTATEYLMKYRIKIAKKQLAFTEVPIKEIAARTGFKTVQHFSRIFRAQTDCTPAAYRKTVVQKRKTEIN